MADISWFFSYQFLLSQPLEVPMVQDIRSQKEKIAKELLVFFSFSFFFNFFKFYLFLRERAWVGERQGERETQNLKQAPGAELSAQSPMRGSNSQTVRSRPEPKSDTQPTEPPRRPCFLELFFHVIIYPSLGSAVWILFLPDCFVLCLLISTIPA